MADFGFSTAQADAILAMRRNDQDREQLRKALERIREIVDSALS